MKYLCIKTNILFLAILLASYSNAETEKEDRADACQVIQEKVDQLNLKYGNWSKVPDAMKTEINSQIPKYECTIIGDSTWNDTGFKMKVK